MRWTRSVLPPVLVGVLALAAWELTVTLGRIAPFILPAPSAIWAEFSSNHWKMRP